MQLLCTVRYVIPPWWEKTLGVEGGGSLIKGSRVKFLLFLPSCLVALFEDMQTRFNGSQWVGSAVVEDRVEASSCLCERVFSYVPAADFGQSTEDMCEVLRVRCNGEAREEWGPFEVFDELRKTRFCFRKRKDGHVVGVEDGGSLGCAALKDLQVSLEEHADSKVPLGIRDLWVVPERATRDTDIGPVYGVGLEDKDEDTDIEDSDQLVEVASSSCHLPNPRAVVSTSSNPASQLVFMYDVDEAVVKAK